ncbi:MAG TPA: hypothetical protein VLT61_08140 [Anaeromyxobacteraceae bacterium]|nr:hypothetical protein [Anaeromyxobacteraceae bacterium]
MHRRTTLLLAVAMVIAVHAWLIAIEVNPLRAGGAWNQLWDPDSYTRLSRVLELRQTGAWYDPTFRGANFPAGFALHWSRFLDALLLGPAWIGSLAMPFARALFGWAVALGPLLQLGAILLMSWGTRPFLRDGEFLLLAAFLTAQRGITYDFLPGLVDHHGLQVFFLLAAIALLLRTPGGRRPGLFAGVAAALAIWASVESVVIAGALGAGLAAAWLLDGARDSARRLLRFAVGAAVTAAICLPLERSPSALLERSYERLSLVQVGLLVGMAAVAALFVASTDRAVASGPLRRLGVALVAGAAVGGLLVVAFPGLVRNPYLDTAGVIQARLLPYIPAEQRFLPTTPDDAYNFVLELGPPLLAVALGAWTLLRSRPGEEERTRLLVTGTASAVFVAYAIYAFRGLPFAAAAGAVPWTVAIVRLWRQVREPGDGRPRIGWPRLAAASGATVGHWAVAAVIALLWMPAVRWKNAPECRWDELAAAVPALSAAEPGGAVLADVFAGPEIHYRTGRPVLGSPYHGNGEGVEATYRLFGAPAAEAAGELEARQVRWVALCAATSADLLNHIRSQPWGLGSGLLMEIPPPGFERVALPPGLDGRFLLFMRRTDR